MSGHTPGPWFTFDNRDLNDAIWIGPARFVSVAEVRMGADDIPGDVEANARLVAMAPELLETLRRIASANEVNTNSENIAQFRSWVSAVANEAIHRATQGEA